MAGLPLALPAPALAQEVQQLLQNKSDPWLMMAAAQAANALPVPRRSGEHRSHLCMTEGCQYQGLAPCAQPFCSEMNRIWATSGVARSG
jgi:molybdenum cofactor biosynthesis enzyme MoaA